MFTQQVYSVTCLLWKLRVAVSAENVGEFIVRPVVIPGEGVYNIVVGSSEPLAVLGGPDCQTELGVAV